MNEWQCFKGIIFQGKRMLVLRMILTDSYVMITNGKRKSGKKISTNFFLVTEKLFRNNKRCVYAALVLLWH